MPDRGWTLPFYNYLLHSYCRLWAVYPGWHYDKGHYAGDYGINADGRVSAVFSKLAVIDKAYKSHGHLGYPEGKAAGYNIF